MPKAAPPGMYTHIYINHPSLPVPFCSCISTYTNQSANTLSTVVFRTFTPPTLLPYNGSTNPSVYLAVRGKVFDVTPGKNFYGPGGPYENFAGRDASRGLACSSFDEEMLTKDLEGPLDDLKGLDAEQMETLSGWEERFEGKYLVVGRLVAVGDEGKVEKIGKKVEGVQTESIQA